MVPLITLPLQALQRLRSPIIFFQVRVPESLATSRKARILISMLHWRSLIHLTRGMMRISVRSSSTNPEATRELVSSFLGRVETRRPTSPDGRLHTVATDSLAETTRWRYAISPTRPVEDYGVSRYLAFQSPLGHQLKS
jgi:hypothetical protein